MINQRFRLKYAVKSFKNHLTNFSRFDSTVNTKKQKQKKHPLIVFKNKTLEIKNFHEEKISLQYMRIINLKI
ncbi:hypothetical protein BpHYR1_048709 [Brachionus plicatilis]|uniref:Uncharacterized protein n=1 Tax=Brachionus plicatilis TaxID=10195 RepID=A0A3M7PRK7_BRAPC|nr:hypothetical protein BpHYR1_048709 [Brachionus plicatilis]